MPGESVKPIRALKFFSRTNAPGSFVLASYHSPHSLTWSWSLWVSFRNVGKWGFYPHRNNHGLQWILALPGIRIDWSRQREMWFRDMFRRAREREDELERLNRNLRRELDKARVAALMSEGRPQ